MTGWDFVDAAMAARRAAHAAVKATERAYIEAQHAAAPHKRGDTVDRIWLDGEPTKALIVDAKCSPNRRSVQYLILDIADDGTVAERLPKWVDASDLGEPAA